MDPNCIIITADIANFHYYNELEFSRSVDAFTENVYIDTYILVADLFYLGKVRRTFSLYIQIILYLYI